MDPISPLAIAFASTTILAGGIAFWSLRQLSRQQGELRLLRDEMLEKEGARAGAVAGHAQMEKEAAELRHLLRTAEDARSDAERHLAAMHQKLESSEQRRQEWEKEKLQMLDAAKAAVMQAGSAMSTKLLEDHKRENEDAKKQAQELTARLMENVTGIASRVEAMREKTEAVTGRMDMVMRALTNPGGAGKMAEVGLENQLKDLGFEPKRDFIMQYHIAGEDGGGALRPDVVIFLPQNTVIVVDSKASKFMIDLEEARGTEREEAVFAQFQKSMREHAKALVGKDYKSAIQDSYRRAGKSSEIGSIMSLMFFPSEGLIDRLRDCDRNVCEYLHKSGIMLVGPTTLYGVFALARTRLAEAQQQENQQKIVEDVADLMESVINALSGMDKLGRGIQSVAESYKAMTGTINSRVLARMRRLVAHGVTPSKNKEVPPPLPVFDVHRSDQTILLEAVEEETAAMTEEKIRAIK